MKLCVLFCLMGILLSAIALATPVADHEPGHHASTAPPEHEKDEDHHAEGHQHGEGKDGEHQHHQGEELEGKKCNKCKHHLNPQQGALPRIITAVTAFVMNPDLRNALIQSLSNPETGPLLLEPLSQMICLAAGKENCTSAALKDVVTVARDAVGSLKDISTIDEATVKIEQLLPALGKIASALGLLDDSTLEKITPEVRKAYWNKISQGNFEDFEGLKEGMYKIVQSGKTHHDDKHDDDDDDNDDSAEHHGSTHEHQRVPIIYGALRLFLADRDLQKVVFKSICDNDELVKTMAIYFQKKYGAAGGLNTVEQFDEAIHTGLKGMLANWEDRPAMFRVMKTMYGKLTGKTMPMGFQMYDAMILGIKSGEIPWDAVLGYLEMAKINPAIIGALKEYDHKVFERFRDIYIPIVKYVGKFLDEHLAAGQV